MKLKQLTLMSAAIMIGGFTNAAQARDSITPHEAKAFVAKLESAINNVDSRIGLAFLSTNVSSNAIFENTFGENRLDGQYHAYRAWSNHPSVSSYYRYPYTYDTRFQPTSVSTVSKARMVNQLQHKKNIIPGYHQYISIIDADIPVGGSSAVLDIRVRELGAAYAPTNTPLYAPKYSSAYMHRYGAQYAYDVEHAESRCLLNLNKDYGDILITKMRCNTILRTAF